MAHKKQMPITGRGYDEIMAELRSFKKEDADWENGKVFCLVYYANQEIEKLSHDVYDLFLHENGLNPIAFPSIKQCETEVVSMVCDLLHGDETTTGGMTSGGTESILLAVKAARERARDKQPHIKEPEMLMPTSIHPAWEKAAYYFGLKTVHVPLTDEFKVDMDQFRAAVTDNTVLIVGSASNYPYGTIDPITAMAAIAKEKDICCHVDACVGGFMLPFLEQLGEKITPWDFRVPGVTSISADLHKYGYVPKGASTILYRSAEYRRYQYYVYTDWPGGVYATPATTGSKPATAVAASWAILNKLGVEGYRELARGILNVRNRFMAGIGSIKGLKILGTPEMTVFSFGSDRYNLYQLVDLMVTRGWQLEAQQNPQSIHMTITSARQEKNVEPFLRDLRECVAQLEEVGEEAVSGLAAVYGMLSTLPDRSMAKELALQFLDDIFKVE